MYVQVWLCTLTVPECMALLSGKWVLLVEEVITRHTIAIDTLAVGNGAHVHLQLRVCLVIRASPQAILHMKTRTVWGRTPRIHVVMLCTCMYMYTCM